MAERGEFGEGRMAEPMEILAAIEARFEAPTPLLKGGAGSGDLRPHRRAH